jgi:hypothetical protein
MTNLSLIGKNLLFPWYACVRQTPMFKVAKHAKETRHLDISLMAYFNRYRYLMHLENRFPRNQSLIATFSRMYFKTAAGFIQLC